MPLEAEGGKAARVPRGQRLDGTGKALRGGGVTTGVQAIRPLEDGCADGSATESAEERIATRLCRSDDFRDVASTMYVCIYDVHKRHPEQGRPRRSAQEECGYSVTQRHSGRLQSRHFLNAGTALAGFPIICGTLLLTWTIHWRVYLL